MSFVSFVSEKLTSSKEMGSSSRDTLFPPCCWSCPAPGKKPGRGGMNGEEAKEEEKEDLEEGGVEAAGLGLPLGLGAVGGGGLFWLGSNRGRFSLGDGVWGGGLAVRKSGKHVYDIIPHYITF